MESRIVCGGRFRVTSGGEIFRIVDGVESPAKISWNCGRRGRYAMVARNENGKQTHYYVHRLIAEAFCEKMDDSEIVMFSDGNQANLSLENIKWASRSELARSWTEKHMRSLNKNAKPCRFCGKLTISRIQCCSECRRKGFLYVNTNEHVSRKYLGILSDFTKEEVLMSAGETQERIVNLVLEGKTTGEISQETGLSRQRIYQILNKVEDRLFFRNGHPPKLKSKTAQAHIDRAKGHLANAKRSLEKKEDEIGRLMKRIEKYTMIIGEE